MKSYLDFFKFGVGNLRKRQMRSWLTMLGIFIGIAAVVSLISLGQGLQHYIDTEFAKLGRDKIMVMPKGAFSGSTAVSLTDKDVKALKRISGISDALGIMYKPVQIEFNKQTLFYSVISVPTDSSRKLFDEMFTSYGVQYGRNVKKGDMYKVVLGHYFYDRDIFKPNIKLGDNIKLNGITFEVIGFFETIGNPDDDTAIYITEDAFKTLYGSNAVYFQLVAKRDSGVSTQIILDRVEKELRKSRGLKEGQEDFSVQSFEDLIKQFNEILLIVQVVLIGIAGISLFVGGIGIMNTMYTAVLERTKEIGIMKAIGARNSDILLIFTIESGILGFMGGVIGIAIGVIFSKMIELIAIFVLQTKLLQAYFPWYLILGSLAFAFIVGSLSGIMPAVQASKLKPVDALRYE